MYYVNILTWNQHTFVFLCIYCAKIVHDNNLFPTRKHLVFAVDSWHMQLTVSVINISGRAEMAAISGQFFSMYWSKFDAKRTKTKWNYTANVIMNVLGTVCQCIHCFPCKQSMRKQLTNDDIFMVISRIFRFLIKFHTYSRPGEENHVFPGIPGAVRTLIIIVTI